MDKQIDALKNDLLKSEFWHVDEETGRFELDRQKTARNLYKEGYRKASDLEKEKRELWEERTRIYNDLQDWKAIAEQYQRQFEEARTDVAREIFEEIEETVRFYLPVIKTANWQLGLKISIAELKKKYTEEGK